VREVGVDGIRVEAALSGWQPGQHRAHQRAEGQPIRAMRVEQGFQAHAVAHQVKLAATQVEQGEGEHAAQFR
jgi:hypothetical protein